MVYKVYEGLANENSASKEHNFKTMFELTYFLKGMQTKEANLKWLEGRKRHKFDVDEKAIDNLLDEDTLYLEQTHKNDVFAWFNIIRMSEDQANAE